MTRIFNFFGGRSTFFAFFFFFFGVALAFLGKLDMNYIALAGAIQALITIRAVAEDVRPNANSHTGS
ncbi:MAG: hypothetical protein MN733_14210 [Nitrososphaera sp.]|nr:hypothetical protein [Nitrososphaera sp.]